MAIFDKVKSIFQSSGGGASKKLDVATRFELEQHAIHGTMSAFRVGIDNTTGERVGLKLLDIEETANLEARFNAKGLKRPNEGEIGIRLNQLRHPNLVETYEYGLTTAGQHYIIMQFLEGPALTSLIRDKEDELVGRRVDLIRQMATAINEVHKAGFIHRDICPKNFILKPNLNHITLFDFGVTVPDAPEFRQPGIRTGTPRYMAPEIVRRRATDKRVDVFSLGVTAFQLLTFEHPWPGEDIRGTAALAFDTVKPRDIFMLRPNLNQSLGTVVMKCLSPKPDDRPSSVDQFLRFIRKVESKEE